MNDARAIGEQGALIHKDTYMPCQAPIWPCKHVAAVRMVRTVKGSQGGKGR